MLFRLLAPFRCHFNQVGVLLHDHESYTQFWATVQQRFMPGASTAPVERIQFLHARSHKTHDFHFSSIYEDWGVTGPEVIRIFPGDSIADLVMRSATESHMINGTDRDLIHIIPRHDRSVFRIFDNTIGTFEIELDMPSENDCIDCSREYLSHFQTWMNFFMDSIVSQYYRSVIFPILVEIWRIDEKNRYIQEPGKYANFPYLTVTSPTKDSTSNSMAITDNICGHPLWTNRTAFCDKLSTEQANEFSKNWVMPLTVGVYDLSRDLCGLDGVYLGWGNNVFRIDSESSVAVDAWNALCLCQYFYAVLDSVDSNLTRILEDSLVSLRIEQAQGIAPLLEELIAATDLISVQFDDAPRNLQGHRKAFFRDLQEKWEMHDLSNNVRRKITICQNRLENLHSAKSRRNDKISEMILLLIGGMAILEVVTTISQYGRELAEITGYGQTGDRIPGLLDLAAKVPPDAMTWSGVAMLLVTALLFSMFKSRSH